MLKPDCTAELQQFNFRKLFIKSKLDKQLTNIIILINLINEELLI